MTCGIYMIQNLVNGKVYVGQALDIERRWKDHKWDLIGNRHINKHLQRSWNRDGEDNFEFTIICECDENQLNTFEQYYIFELMSYDPKIGYNKAYGGGQGGRPTEETRKKMSEARKGKTLSEEARKKLSEARKGKYTGENSSFYGKHHTEESKQKISDANKGENNYMYGRTGKLCPNYGRNPSEETRKKLSEVNKGKTLSEETRKKIGEASKGKIMSEEARKKLSEAHKGKIVSEETRKKLSEARKGKFTGEEHPFYGKHHSEETRKKLSESNKGKIMAEETKRKISENSGSHRPEVRKKISESLKGRIFSEEHKKKLSEASKGKIMSEETRKKLSEAQKGEKNHNYGKRGANWPTSIPIVQLTISGELVKVYDAIKEAERSGFSNSCITGCCKGKRKTHKGYKWMYLSEYEAMKKEGLEK